VKRLSDLFILIFTFPFWGTVILFSYIINILLEGFPGFYFSRRYVGNGKNIKVAKIRVMKKNIDKKLNRETVQVKDQLFLNLPNSKSIYTNFGSKLESLGITELPQFFSVIKGDMSIVGARPLPYNVYEELKKEFPHLASKRFNSKCGLTGLPQLIGRDFISDQQRLDLEARYSDWANTRYSFLVDLRILVYTVLIVLGFKKHLTFKEATRMLN
jgi:lipopolysaccharide/colanic/teichoic acid biosynthesis glycosyltransferase